MAPGSDFGMEKINPAQKINNKVDGTPKPESKKVKGKIVVKLFYCCFLFFLPDL